MSTLPSRQRGLTLWGAIFVFGTLGFIALCVIKIGPLYLNEASVRKAVADVAGREGSTDGQVDIAAIRSALQKRWDVDYIKQVEPADVKVIREGNSLFLAYDYEARVDLFGNIAVVTHFAHKSPLRAQAGLSIADRETLQRALGHRFGDPALLERALTHRSAAAAHNERLEFLGDALLNLATADLLYRARAQSDEGDLSRLRASLVREETLAAVARRLDLGDVVNLGPGELRSGGFRRDSILADALEAIIGAVYLDAGFDATRALCQRLLAPEVEALPAAGSLKDAKTRLQEWLQAIPRPLPEYTMLREDGPPHRRRFTVRCTLTDDALVCEGSGPSRRLAEQAAAERMLEHLLPTS